MDATNNSDACAKRRLKKNKQKQEAPPAHGAAVNASTHAGSGGRRSPTNAPVVNILLQEPPSARSAQATCKSCNKELDPTNRWRCEKFRVHGTWPRSCFGCMRASSAAILRRLQALETMIAALLRPTPPSKLTQQSSPFPTPPPPVAPHPPATTYPTPPVGPHLTPAVNPPPSDAPNLDTILTVEELEATTFPTPSKLTQQPSPFPTPGLAFIAERIKAKAKADASALAPSTPPRATAPPIAPPGPAPTAASSVRVGDIVECLRECDNGWLPVLLWLPARVTRCLAGSLEVTLLADNSPLGGTFEVHKSLVRNVADLAGDPIPAVTDELECHVWFASDERYLMAVVLGQKADDTAVIRLADEDDYRQFEVEVPVAYLRTSASIEAFFKARDTALIAAKKTNAKAPASE